MTADNPISALLSAPLSPDWTVEKLAEELLSTIATQRTTEVGEFILDADAGPDRQTRRVLRPLLACLAGKSAAEAGTSTNLYGGHLSFKRPGANGPVWVLGHFENSPGKVRVVFRRSNSPPEKSEAKPVQTSVLASSDSPHNGATKSSNQLPT